MKYFKELRKEKTNLTIRQASDLIGMHYTYLCRVENNQSNPSDEIVEKICKAYGLTKKETYTFFWNIRIPNKYKLEGQYE